MSSHRWFGRSNLFLSRASVAIAAAAVLAGAALAFVVVRTWVTDSRRTTGGFALKKGDLAAKVNANKRALFGATEVARPLHARDGRIPQASVSRRRRLAGATVGAWNGLGVAERQDAFRRNLATDRTEHRQRPGCVERAWRRRPVHHRRPRHRDGARAELHEGNCRLYVAAAGGGVWRTERRCTRIRRRSGSSFPAASARTRIGSLLLDPTRSHGQHAVCGAPVRKTPPATRKPASASTRQPTAATPGRSFPAATCSSSGRSARWRSTARGICSCRSAAASAASAR